MKAFRSIWKRSRRLEDLAFLTEVMTQFSVKVVDYLQPDFCWDAEVQHATLNVGQFLGRKCGHFPSRTLLQSAISNETTTMRRSDALLQGNLRLSAALMVAPNHAQFGHAQLVIKRSKKVLLMLMASRLLGVAPWQTSGFFRSQSRSHQSCKGQFWLITAEILLPLDSHDDRDHAVGDVLPNSIGIN